MDGSQTGATLTVVGENIDLDAQGLFKLTQQNQYVMDRRKMVNVADDRAWAYDPANKVDRSGAYRLNFPLDTKAQPYPIYNNETQTTYQVKPSGRDHIEGIDVYNFLADVEYRPVTAAYLATLDKALPKPLPRQLTAAQLAPLLASRGIDLQTVLINLLPRLAPAELPLIQGLVSTPVKVQYVLSNKGSDAVDRSTGGIVDVRNVQQRFAAVPDPTLVPKLEALLAKYTSVPGVTDVANKLKTLASNPIPIFDNTFSQTPASVKDIASTVNDNRDMKKLAEDTIPLILLVVGIVLAVIGIVLIAIPKRVRDGSMEAPPPEPGAASP